MSISTIPDVDDAGARHETDYFPVPRTDWAPPWAGDHRMLNRAPGPRKKREGDTPSNAGPVRLPARLWKNATAFWTTSIFEWNKHNGPTVFHHRPDARIFPGDPETTGGLVIGTAPGDGSWTFFLDSIGTTYELKEAKTKID